MPRIRFMDGFDHLRESSIPLKYNGFSQIFLQGFNTTGYLGQSAYFLQNVAFYQTNFTHKLGDFQQTIIFGCWFKPNVHNPNTLIFRVEDGGAASTQLGLMQTNTGTFKLIRGGNGTNGSGTILGETSEAWPVNEWHHLEFRARINAGSGYVDVMKDGRSVFRFDGNTQATSHNRVDRVTFRLQEAFNGYTLDHYYIADNDNGATDADLVGPAKIETRWPNADELNFWARSAGVRNFELVDDYIRSNALGKPDTEGDNAYIVASTPSDDYYKFPATDCFGLVLAVAVSAAVRSAGALNTATTGMYRAGGVNYEIGPDLLSPSSSAYTVLQWVSNKNPARSSAAYRDRDIYGEAWGIRTKASGPVRCSQLVIEKLASLVKPGDCGQGSYAF